MSGPSRNYEDYYASQSGAEPQYHEIEGLLESLLVRAPLPYEIALAVVEVNFRSAPSHAASIYADLFTRAAMDPTATPFCVRTSGGRVFLSLNDQPARSTQPPSRPSFDDFAAESASPSFEASPRAPIGRETISRRGASVASAAGEPSLSAVVSTTSLPQNAGFGDVAAPAARTLEQIIRDVIDARIRALRGPVPMIDAENSVMTDRDFREAQGTLKDYRSIVFALIQRGVYRPAQAHDNTIGLTHAV